jgi:hypothetical protein
VYALPKNVFSTLLLLSAMFLSSCGRAQTLAPAAASTNPQSGGGTIAGRVVLTGNPPSQQIIPGSPMIKDETLVCDPAGGLKNVIVFLSDAPATLTPPSLPPAVLDQINCVYVPHVLAIETGQPFIIKSSDTCLHNVQFQSVRNPPFNLGFPGPSSKQITLDSAEPPFRVKCDVHPWMSAWIGVFNNPYFAVTATDGSFTIPHVPPGTYTLAAWQEALPQQQQSVTVYDNSTTNVQFKFDLP